MKAVGYRKSLPIENARALEDLEIAEPVPGPHDLLVRVRAIAVNPVDTKMRVRRPPSEGKPEILGWDAVGVVISVGGEVRGFKPGDRVFYAGALDRPGANSELHVVDGRIAALAPSTLGDEQAAALPLTSLTAYELLFDRMGVAKGGGEGKTLLVVGGAGGVGSILIQLAKQLTKLKVVATASRADTRAWCLELGADHVIDHSQPLSAQLAASGLGEVDLVAGLTHTGAHWDEIIASIKPQGRIGVIDMDAAGAVDAGKLMSKSLSLHVELMFTRSLYQTPDIAEQGRVLAEIAALADEKRIRSTASESFGRIQAENLKRAHAVLESGRAMGKITLAGF